MNSDSYFDQSKLSKINGLLCEDIESLFDHLGIEYSRQGKMIVSACPVHDGDNQTAFNLYTEELPNGLLGNWKCRTHQCEEKHGNNILALLRSMLGLPWKKTVDWACAFIGVNYENMQGVSSSEAEKRKFIAGINSLNNKPKQENRGVPRSTILKSLRIPCDYYVERGYCSEVLQKYDVGLCDNPRKKMYQRAVVPIYNNTHDFAVGFTARATFNDYKYKWIHSNGFQANSYLYNYWFAKSHIMETGTVILVEGPGDVWKLEESGIHISLAMFGTELSEQQLSLLYGCGANSIIVLTDNDEAGRKSAEKIQDKCKRLFRMFFPKLSASDVGDMAGDDITKDIQPIIQQALSVSI